MEKDPRDTLRLEKKIEELVKLTKQNNKILRGERNTRRLRTVVFVVIAATIYFIGYQQYNKYQTEILTLLSLIGDVQNQVQEFNSLGKQIREQF